MDAEELIASEVQWEATGDGELPYRFERWFVRVNDFPAEPLYTVMRDGEAVDLEDWPTRWRRP